MKVRALTNPRVQECDRERAKTPERKAQARRISVRWRTEHPDAYKAHTAVNNAVRDGRLKKQPCAICGTDKVHAHHQDYAKPLEVKWLCAKCHHRVHATFPELGGHFQAAE
jgi:ribosomal protein S27AE